MRRTIREDIDKKRIEKQLGNQAAQRPAAPAGGAAGGGLNPAVIAAAAVLVPLALWLATRP